MTAADTPASRLGATVAHFEEVVARYGSDASQYEVTLHLHHGGETRIDALCLADLRAVLDEHEQLRAEPRAACHLCRAPLGITICTDCGKDLAADGVAHAKRQAESAPQQPEQDRPACQRCRIPFDPNDTSYVGHARHDDSPWCRECVDHCHESPDPGHRCGVCTASGT